MFSGAVGQGTATPSQIFAGKKCLDNGGSWLMAQALHKDMSPAIVQENSLTKQVFIRVVTHATHSRALSLSSDTFVSSLFMWRMTSEKLTGSQGAAALKQTSLAHFAGRFVG